MTQLTLTGSCLCGALEYRATGEVSRFMHCHCSRCRKSTGTGHATNLFLKDGTLTWTGDTALIKTYKVPQAQRFTRTFCSQCGGPLPAEIASMNLVFIPAGTLDVDPDVKPQARIFYESRTAWSCGGDELPCFGSYPT